MPACVCVCVCVCERERERGREGEREGGRLVNLIFFLHSENMLVLVWVILFVNSVFSRIVGLMASGLTVWL